MLYSNTIFNNLSTVHSLEPLKFIKWPTLENSVLNHLDRGWAKYSPWANEKKRLAIKKLN